MAIERQEEAEEPILLEEEAEEADNAQTLTSGLIFTTFGLLVLAILMMVKATGKWFDVGFLKNI